MSDSAEYHAWEAMVARCYNPHNASYARYGGRGIAVCAEWRRSPGRFIQEVGPRPSAAHSLDRIDNTRGYEPGNVRWATAREQQANTARAKFLTYQDETLCVSEWARRYGLTAFTLHMRLRLGWPAERALLEPVRAKRTYRRRTM